MSKFSAGLGALLIAAVAAAASMFVLKENVAASDDSRTIIILSAGERNAVLAEMRVFLESVQAITTGLAEKDMQTIAVSARRSGMAAAQDVPQALRDKLPLEFKKLGMATHKAFDALAREAQDIGDKQVMLSKLGNLLQNCTTCHAGYRIADESSKSK